jgi:hypothetical protein
MDPWTRAGLGVHVRPRTDATRRDVAHQGVLKVKGFNVAMLSTIFLKIFQLKWTKA